MKVKCVDNSGFEDQLTVGDVYLVLVLKSWNEVKVVNDNEAGSWYGLNKFAWSECV